jgi:hypothetical protein
MVRAAASASAARLLDTLPGATIIPQDRRGLDNESPIELAAPMVRPDSVCGEANAPRL